MSDHRRGRKVDLHKLVAFITAQPIHINTEALLDVLKCSPNLSDKIWLLSLSWTQDQSKHKLNCHNRLVSIKKAETSFSMTSYANG